MPRCHTKILLHISILLSITYIKIIRGILRGIAWQKWHRGRAWHFNATQKKHKCLFIRVLHITWQKKWRGTPQREKNKTNFNFMNQALIKSLYQRGDPKRKKVLYQAYQQVFHAPYSYEQVVLTINEDLKEEIISYADVKYIREKFVNRKKKQKTAIHLPKTEIVAAPKGIFEEIAQEVAEKDKQKVNQQNQDFLNKFLNND